MPRQPEGRVVAKIRHRIEERGGRAFKIQASEGSFQEIGIPDILACFQGAFLGLEVKQAGEKPSAIQRQVLKEIEAAGGIAAVVTSVDETDNLLDGVIDRSVAAWIAGFFDGEGCISVNQGGTPFLRIYQNDPSPLRQIREVLGMGTIRLSRKVHVLRIGKKKDVTRFLSVVGPYIRLRHRRQKVEEACDLLGVDVPMYYHDSR
jgi:hypothetical protein